MGFDKDYPNRKDRHRPYHRSGRFDRACRPGGSCPNCRNNRLFSDRRRRAAADEQLKEFLRTKEDA